jgi:3-oxoacyl-[acyl-carrier protein] reductase
MVVYCTDRYNREVDVRPDRARVTGEIGSRRVVVVTGAGGALGTAVARRLASESDTALVLSDVSDRSLAATLSDVGEGPTPVVSVRADVTDFAQVEAVVDSAVQRFGHLDVLISNAGVLSPNGRIHNLTDEDWERAFRINVLGAVNGIRAAVAVMRPRRSGSIVLTASVAGLTAWSHSAPYCATKAAVIQLAKVAALEYARDGIRVNCVCPGTFRSAMHHGLPEEALEAIAARHPLGLGSADDLAGAYAYLAGGDARWTTGSALVIDGGYSVP